MTKKERVSAAVHGEKVDRVPVSAWKHFPPKDRIIDGRDMLSILKGETPSLQDTLYYYKGRSLVGVRHKNWKYLRRHMTDNGGYASLRQGPFLFDLESDPNESYSLIESEPEVARMLVALMDEWEARMRRNVRGWL